jgi:hypothetical protein
VDRNGLTHPADLATLTGDVREEFLSTPFTTASSRRRHHHSLAHATNRVRPTVRFGGRFLVFWETFAPKAF